MIYNRLSRRDRAARPACVASSAGQSAIALCVPCCAPWRAALFAQV